MESGRGQTNWDAVHQKYTHVQGGLRHLRLSQVCRRSLKGRTDRGPGDRDREVYLALSQKDSGRSDDWKGGLAVAMLQRSTGCRVLVRRGSLRSFSKQQGACFRWNQV